ncbi:MAG: hypothetical protein FIA95_02355, partial [Gemmatimonadetes bacterium]|nr:hypothetical protein [Gemmatimonadota bacterium]
ARAPEARDLGTVQPHDAVAFLTQTARRGVGDAVFPILLADVEDAWKEVMALAEDRGVTGDVRRTALFWVGQEAAEAATEGLAEVASDEEEDREVREAAVFALSQRPAAEGVPILMEVARSAREPSTRRSAFFWLAQSRDARVVSFFRQVLLGGRGG